MKSKVFVLVMALIMCVTMAGFASAETDPQEEAETKDIRIQSREKRLEVEITSRKNVYDVNEPITLRVKANKKAYIYLFNISEKSDKALLLYPNKYEQMNRLQANMEATIPTRSEFVSDKPGVEHLILVASPKKLKVSYKEIVGEKFYAVQKSIVDGITKDIRIVPKEEDKGVVKELDVIIKGKEEAQGPATVITDDALMPIVLVSTDKITYKVKEKMTIAYASDTEGILSLFYVNPEKKVTLLKEAKVDKNKVYRLKAVTDHPRGEHFLMAVLKEKEGEEKSIEAFVKGFIYKDETTKDISLVSEPEAYAVYHFVIE